MIGSIRVGGVRVYQRMLVTLDGSESSEKALPYVKELAGRLGINTTLLYVGKPEEREIASMHRTYIECKAETMKRQVKEVRKRAETSSEKKTVQVRGELATGYPAEEILRYADENSIDLITMATRRCRSGIRRWIMRSVADEVIRFSKIPVWLINAGTPDKIAYDKWPRRTILVPLDGSELAEAVLPHAETLAKQWRTEPVEVVLFGVAEPTVALGYYPPSGRFGTSNGAVHVMPQDYVMGEVDKQKILCEQYLGGIGERLEAAGLNVRSEVRTGEPAEQIADYANANPFNLIVMSTRGRSWLSRWAYSAITAKVLQKASSPVFLVRPSQPEPVQA